MSDSATELQQLVDALPQYEDQIRYWESQLQAISNVRADIVQAQETLNGMLDSNKEMEMLVPVGHNTSIFTTVDDLDRILVGLGSRVYMETSRKDSLKRLNNRLEDLEKASQTYQENLSKSQQDYVTIRERAEYLNSNPEAE
ncbi:MAG: prefoldin subunit alpha [Candidatus Thermoplasmatota archaeon]|nr:prefoldin subunit alpha [Candidatus Thermoplasmatota archaeon]